MKRFCYLCDTVGDGGVVVDSVFARIRNGWSRFMGLKTFLTTRGLFEEAKGGLYYCLFVSFYSNISLSFSQKFNSSVQDFNFYY